MKQLNDILETTTLSTPLQLFLQNRTEVEIASDEIYLNYPELFANSFKQIEQEKIDTLNVSGFLYYKSVLLLDGLIDNKTTTLKAEQLFLSNKLQEESIKLLTSVFSLDKTFWELWNIRQQEYFRAIQLEKQLALKPNYKKYQQVADYKAAFGKVAIDCLYVLSGKKDIQKYNDLLLSHYHFSVGLQLIDDLQDLEEDIKNNQFNWAYYQTTTLLKKEKYNIRELDIPQIKKLIYLKGIATIIRKEALKQLGKSKKIAQKHSPIKWITVIENQEKEIQQAIDKINSYLCQLYAQTQLSSDFVSNTNITLQLSLAKDFIAKQQNNDGSWLDYNTNAGMSNIWSTAFILNNICDANFKDTFIQKSTSFLLDNQQNNFWGYNTSMLPDNDSTSFVLLALYKNNGAISKKNIETYIAQQFISGGYSTYSDEKALSNYLKIPIIEIQGWMQEHVCVSAVSYYLMETININHTIKDKLYNFLLKHQNINGLWDSYWWTSPIYATSFIIQAYFINHTKLTERINKAISGLLVLQQNDGSFIDNHKVKSPFFTALAIIALSSNHSIFVKYYNKIRLATQWLLSQQTKDGSFLSTYALQIPEPNVANPKSIKTWSKEKNQVTNIIANDFMRLFTTSTCIKALHLFNKNESE